MYTNSKQKDFDREGPTLLKLLQLVKLFFPKYTQTLARIAKFSDLNIKKLNELKGLKIKGIILDADECIAYNHGEILEKNVNHIKRLSEGGIKIVIYSNMRKTKRYDPIAKYAKILTRVPPKPNVEGFKKAVALLELPIENIIMVGDNYITDSGSLALGIPFVKIKPIKTKHITLKDKILMPPYGLLRSFYSKIAQLHDLFRKKPLTSRDLKDNKKI